MKSFLHGLGGGLGRGIGRFIAILAISFLIYFVVNLLDLDIKNDILNRVLMLDVSAKEQVINTNISSRPYMPCSSSGGTNSYCVQDTSNNSIVRTKGNIYNGVLLDLTFQFQQQLNSSMASQFVIDIYAMSTDFRNNNFSALFYSSSTYDSIGSLGNFTYSFVSKNQVRLIVYPDNLTYHTVILSGSPLTGVNTYGIKKVTITYDDGQQDNSGIINNQNQNTQDIIDNNNSNTQDIIQQVQDLIANNEELKNQLIQAQSCPIGPLAVVREDWTYIENKYLDVNGSQITSSGYSISPYIDILPSTEYNLTLSGQFNTPSVCFYKQKSTTSSSLISCEQYSRRTSFSVTSPSNAEYMLVSFLTTGGVTIKGPVCNDWQKEAQDKLNNTINDDSIDQSQADSFFSDFEDNDHGLSGIVTLPLTTIQSLTSKQCIALQLPVPFTNEHFSLPCMSEIYQSKVPALYNLWQVVCYGLIGYWIATDIFKLVKGFKDPEQDKVEVMDL